MKILNLYACLGGNRYKWSEQHDITAVELDEDLAMMYKERFPNDKVIIADAHQYLLDHYKQFDFIWSSPPCPTHSRARYWKSKNYETNVDAVYPDMNLYQEIIFLEHLFKGKYVVENVIPYYKPLIKGQVIGRHIYWSNVTLPKDLNHRHFDKLCQDKDEFKRLCEFHKIDLYSYKGNQRKLKIARNLVDYVLGESILNAVIDNIENNTVRQNKLF